MWRAAYTQAAKTLQIYKGFQAISGFIPFSKSGDIGARARQKQKKMAKKAFMTGRQLVALAYAARGSLLQRVSDPRKAARGRQWSQCSNQIVLTRCSARARDAECSAEPDKNFHNPLPAWNDGTVPSMTLEHCKRKK